MNPAELELDFFEAFPHFKVVPFAQKEPHANIHLIYGPGDFTLRHVHKSEAYSIACSLDGGALFPTYEGKLYCGVCNGDKSQYADTSIVYESSYPNSILESWLERTTGVNPLEVAFLAEELDGLLYEWSEVSKAL